jgi:hypothetical protein
MNYLEQITSHIPSEDMDKTINFMVNVLDFESARQSDSYCELTMGNHALGVLSSDGEPNQQSIYLRVKNIDALWEKIKDKLDSEHPQRPFDREYGMREIHLIIPGTATLLFLGSAI